MTCLHGQSSTFDYWSFNDNKTREEAESHGVQLDNMTIATKTSTAWNDRT
jgi:hypothetical protein